MYWYIKFKKYVSSPIVFGLMLLLFSGWWNCSSPSYAQSFLSLPAVKITSPESNNQQVPVGELVISGTSSDNSNTDCTIYVDWNDLKPYQKVVATGADGNDDYSNWTFTYTDSYHLITNGTNDLTSKISCFGNPLNLTKYYSINVTGVESKGATPQQESEIAQEQEEKEGEDDDIPLSLPFVSADAEEDSSQLNSDDYDANEEKQNQDILLANDHSNEDNISEEDRDEDDVQEDNDDDFLNGDDFFNDDFLNGDDFFNQKW
jgi:hypothetical protein